MNNVFKTTIISAVNSMYLSVITTDILFVSNTLSTDENIILFKDWSQIFFGSWRNNLNLIEVISNEPNK
jgi:hypothetical protein